MPRIIPDNYIKLSEVPKLFTELVDEAYLCTFSLDVLIEKVSEIVSDSCEVTQSNFISLFEKYQEWSKKEDPLIHENEEFRNFIKLMVPGTRLASTLSYLTKPFGTTPIFTTDGLLDLVQNESYYTKNIYDEVEIRKLSKIKYRTFLLQSCFGIENLYNSLYRIEVEDLDRGIIRYFQLRMNNEYVKATFKEKAPKLEDGVVDQLVKNITDDDLWDLYFSPNSISFEGFSSYFWEEITDVETFNLLSQKLKEVHFDENQRTYMDQVKRLMKNYLQNDKIDFGFVNLNIANIPIDSENSQSLVDWSMDEFQGNIGSNSFSEPIQKMIATGELVVVPNLDDYKGFKYENALISKGYHCVLYAPLYLKGQLAGWAEYASKELIFYDHFFIEKVRLSCIELEKGYELITESFRRNLTAIIQEEFTAIHPSVQWKFEEVVSKRLLQTEENTQQEFDPIIFNELIPLYGQTDIIGSSNLRNQSIQKDLLKNLSLLSSLMSSLDEQNDFLLLIDYHQKVNKAIDRIKNDFSSSEENNLSHLIKDEIHPYLNHLHKRYPLDNERYHKYLAHLDPELGIVYDARKRFEESVTFLTASISEFLEKEDNKMQLFLPHYFEKYKTDGIEYNIYLGQSILNSGNFNEFDITEFRMWQLVNMCKIVNLINQITPELSQTLQTAQLIFVYNAQLSIRFRVDEKKFDVDGAYNIRYEILKKRIDKATIKDTNERLTAQGKIAIVYLSESDKTEYLKYLQFLQERKMIEEEYEDLTLNKMQGIEGLKALRVKVCLTNDTKL